jgi:hypothetical protein
MRIAHDRMIVDVLPVMDGSPLSETLLCHDSGSFEEGAKVMDVSVLGFDLGKNSCSVVGLDTTGKVVVRRRMRRETVITYAAALPACVVGALHMWTAPSCKISAAVF